MGSVAVAKVGNFVDFVDLRGGGDMDMGLGLCGGGVESNDVIAGRVPTCPGQLT